MDGNLLLILRDRDTALYLGGRTVSAFGDTAMSLAAGIWVKTLTGSDSLAALVGFCFWLPTFAGPAIGTVADRVRRRPLLIGTNLALAGVLILPLAVRSEQHVWLLFVVLGLVGAGTVLADAAEVALLTAIVPAELRGHLNGLVRTALESAKLLAPLAGAGLFALAGGHAVALLDSLTFLATALVFALIRTREAAPAPSRRPWRKELGAGVGYLWSHATLRPLVLTGGVALLASSLSSTATYALLDAGLGLTPAFAGVLTASQGLGSVVSGLTSGALLRRVPERAFAAAGTAAFALGCLLRAVPWTPGVVLGSLLVGLGLPCPLLAALTALQRETPDALLGRVAATANTLIFTPAGLGLLIGTGMVAGLDHRVQLLTAGGLALVTAAALVRPAARVPTGDVDPVHPDHADHPDQERLVPAPERG